VQDVEWSWSEQNSCRPCSVGMHARQLVWTFLLVTVSLQRHWCDCRYQQRPRCEANVNNQLHSLCSPKVHYRVHKSPCSLS
jgi:hypothetical protein